MPNEHTQTIHRPRGARSQRALSPVLRIALLLGLVVHLAGFLIFKVTTKPLPKYEATDPYVVFVSPNDLAEDRELEETAVLLDSAPLFLPTQWNAVRNLAIPPVRQEKPLFADFEPQIELENELEPSYLASLQGDQVEQPQDLLTLPFLQVFEPLGRIWEPVPEIPESSPLALVRTVDSGRGLLAAEELRLPVDLGDAAGIFPEAPAAFYLRVGGSGRMLGAVVLAASSGNAAYDAAARSWLESAEVLARLPAGYLSVRIFP
ncbi:hypothetical protein [Coraliomargarita parva]|uniref:hypothetical protein n=1 Tax=Coraliomargarita parva TaxID=3014050 RepID=UPI0022B4F194|nr:hypothetical protein [Coraliomargarita parva]